MADRSDVSVYLASTIVQSVDPQTMISKGKTRTFPSQTHQTSPERVPMLLGFHN